MTQSFKQKHQGNLKIQSIIVLQTVVWAGGSGEGGGEWWRSEKGILGGIKTSIIMLFKDKITEKNKKLEPAFNQLFDDLLSLTSD